MNLGKRILAGAFALAIGTSVALPTMARADSDDWHHRDHHSWFDHDHDRDDNGYYGNGPYNGYYGERPSGPYAYQRRHIPPNGEGMINRRNPNFYWACDSEGHHCHWARR